MEDKETIEPKTINGFDFSFPFCEATFFVKSLFLSLLIRFEKGLITLKNLVNYQFIDLNKSL